MTKNRTKKHDHFHYHFAARRWSLLLLFFFIYFFSLAFLSFCSSEKTSQLQVAGCRLLVAGLPVKVSSFCLV